MQTKSGLEQTRNANKQTMQTHVDNNSNKKSHQTKQTHKQNTHNAKAPRNDRKHM